MIRSVALSLVRGFAMGAADIVPGVSGGTIALIFGIYERLIASVKAGSSALGNLVKFDLAGFRQWFGKVDWVFIIPLGTGILLAILLLAEALESLLINEAVLMASLFVGLVLGSIVITWRMLKNVTPRLVGIAAAVGIVVFVVLGLRGGTSEESVAQISDPALWAFLGAGAIAIVAMILPGISGSFLLVLMGMYGPVLGAVTDRDLAALGVFFIGAVIGLALFSQVLDRALNNHHDLVLASLIGLMAGSMRVLWPWPLGVDSTALGTPDSDIIASILVAAIGLIAVIAIASIAQKLEVSDRASTESSGSPAS